MTSLLLILLVVAVVAEPGLVVHLRALTSMRS
jgi:hypothetical protein